MSLREVEYLKTAIIQLEGKIDGVLELMNHMGRDIGDLQKAFAHLNSRIHALEHEAANGR